MNAARIVLASLALTAVAAFPAGAAAATLVPPGNSAANQYTETFPTTGGNAEAKGKGKVTAGDVLGAGNAKKLDARGKQGREAAAVAAETAPPPIAPAEAGGGAGSPAGGGSGQGDSGASGAGNPKGGGDAAGGQVANRGAPAASASPTGSDSAPIAATDGSSGFGEVLGQATGSTSDGGTGWLLPLVVLASLVWALVFLLRRRRPTA